MSDRKVIIVLLAVVATFVVGVILNALQSVLLPLVVAIFLSYLFKPLVIFLKQKRIPTALTLIAVFITIAAVLLGVSMVVYASVDSFIEQAPKYQSRINEIAIDAEKTMRNVAARFDLPTGELGWRSVFDVSSITAILGTGIGSAVTFLGNVVLVMFYMFFILAATGNLSEKIRESFIESHSHRIAGIITNIDRRVRQYLLTKTLISLVTGALTTGILLIFGVDFALFWGFIAFLLNYIPNIGSLLAQIFPVVLAFIQFDSLVTPLIILALLAGMQTLMGNVVDPKVMAFSLNLSPLVVLVALIFWGWLWGVVGMIIAVPMTSILKIIFESFDELRPVARLMGDAIEPKPSEG